MKNLIIIVGLLLTSFISSAQNHPTLKMECRDGEVTTYNDFDYFSWLQSEVGYANMYGKLTVNDTIVIITQFKNGFYETEIDGVEYRSSSSEHLGATIAQWITRHAHE